MNTLTNLIPTMESSMFPEHKLTPNEKVNPSRIKTGGRDFVKGQIPNPKGRPTNYELAIKKRTEVETIGRLMQLGVLYGVKSLVAGDVSLEFYQTNTAVEKRHIEPPQHPLHVFEREEEESKINPGSLTNLDMKAFGIKNEMAEEFEEFQRLIDDPLGYEESQVKDAE